MQKFMGGGGREMSRDHSEAMDLWEENNRLHGDAGEFGQKWYSILGICQRFAQKDPSNRPERCRI